MSNTEKYTNIIIGAGPAGLQMAYLLGRAGRSYLVLEAASGAGAFFETQPRHRKLLSINKVHNHYPEPEFNLRHDWNSLLSDGEGFLFKEFSSDLFPNADALVSYLRNFAQRAELRIRYETPVSHIHRDDAGFEVATATGDTLRCERLFVATGAVAENLPDDIEGIELADTYNTHTLDKATYENKRVAIIGAGNSAFETANHLAGSAAVIHILVKEPVKHAWQTHFPGHLRAVNNDILDMYQLKSLHATLGFVPKKIIRKPDGVFRVSMEEECPHWSTPSTIGLDLDYDAVICCTGWKYVPTQLFSESAQPELSPCGRYPVLSPTWESSVPGMYFIGTSMAARDKKAASPFIHGFRYNVRTLFNILDEQHEGASIAEDWGQIDEAAGLRQLCSKLVDRVSVASGLYQMNAVLVDVVVVKDGRASYFRELPVEHVAQREDFRVADFYMTVSLEYGFSKYPEDARALDFIHPSDVYRSECSAFLHPILRLWKGGVMVREQHFGESLTIRYDQFFTRDAFGEEYVEVFRRRNENRIANFLNPELGVFEGVLDDERFSQQSTHGLFRPWSKEEIDAYEKAQKQKLAMRDEPPCRS